MTDGVAMVDRKKQVRCPVCNHPQTAAAFCAECRAELSMSDSLSPSPLLPSFFSVPPMRYQNEYVWLIFVSALDVFLTMLVLFWWTGREVNPIAAAVIAHMGFGWMIVLKFALIVLVVIICEIVGRKSDRAGRRLAVAAVVISAFPVVYSFALLFKAEPPIDTTSPIQVAFG
jgi:hypothetical protein